MGRVGVLRLSPGRVPARPQSGWCVIVGLCTLRTEGLLASGYCVLACLHQIVIGLSTAFLIISNTVNHRFVLIDANTYVVSTSPLIPIAAR